MKDYYISHDISLCKYYWILLRAAYITTACRKYTNANKINRPTAKIAPKNTAFVTKKCTTKVQHNMKDASIYFSYESLLECITTKKTNNTVKMSFMDNANNTIGTSKNCTEKIEQENKKKLIIAPKKYSICNEKMHYKSAT